MRVRVRSTDDDRRELYQVLNLREKLRTGQAYLNEVRVSKHDPRSRMVQVRLTVNDYAICLAHQFGHSGPDPKRIDIDDLSYTQD